MTSPIGATFPNLPRQHEQPLYRHSRPVHSDTDRGLSDHAVPGVD